MAGMQTRERFDVETLWVDSILTSSVPIDWSESYDNVSDFRSPDELTWTSYEAPECADDGEYAVWDADEGAWKCPTCGEEIDDEGEGPMMSYHYPLQDLRRVGDDPHEAASRISDLPLCVVEFSDGSYSLALTGGGMDLSWEICEAFTRLGYLPPFRFTQNLPKLAGMSTDPYVLAACKRTCDVLKGWTEQASERLDTF